jgi:hypothetical protein
MSNIFCWGRTSAPCAKSTSYFWIFNKTGGRPIFFLSRPNIWIKKRVGRAQPNGYKNIEQAAIFKKTQLPFRSTSGTPFFLPTSRNFQIKANQQQWRIQVISTVIVMVPTWFTTTSLISSLEQVQRPMHQNIQNMIVTATTCLTTIASHNSWQVKTIGCYKYQQIFQFYLTHRNCDVLPYAPCYS